MKPAAALDPVDGKVLCQKSGAGHPDILLNPAGQPELPHPSIDQREARLAALPRPARKGERGRTGRLRPQVPATTQRDRGSRLRFSMLVFHGIPE